MTHASRPAGRTSDRTADPPVVAALPDLAAPPTLWPLKQLVFWAGAVLMGLEIAGSRVLAPHFGNSVFVWGSLISVFLLALSVGYYVGGWVADHRPSQRLLSLICIAVAISIFVIAVVAYPVCDALAGTGLGEQTGPLVAATILFLPSSIGMGMVSPFAVRLATQSVSGVGRSAGTLYALSTMGSIAGTLLTTFVLIPQMGVTSIIKGLAAALLLVALLALPWRTPSQGVVRLLVFALIALPSVFTPAPSRAVLRPGDHLVRDFDTPYHHVSVIDNRRENSRQLKFDRFVESEIRKTPPYESLATYTDYFHLAFLLEPKIESTLFIGAGGGVGPRAFRLHSAAMAIDVVDIDPKVIQIAKEYFHLDDAKDVRTFAKDGRMFVRDVDRSYDCIVLDAFTIGGGIPFHLATKEFFEACRDRLSDRGVFVMNINSAVTGPDAAIFRSLYRMLQQVFPQTYPFAMGHGWYGDDMSTNILLVGTKSKDRLPVEQWKERGAAFASGSYITAGHIERMIDDLVTDVPDLTSAPIFTDDYAPLETLAF